MSAPKNSRVASLTNDGKCANVLMQTAMIAMLVTATVTSGDIHGHLSGEVLDPQLVQEVRESVRTWDSLVCTSECRGTEQLERQCESSDRTITRETEIDQFLRDPGWCPCK